MKKLVIAFALVASTIVACSSSTTDPTGSSSGTSGTPAVDSGAPAGNNIVVKSNMFVPAALTIKVGDTVTWTWEGGAHTVTSGPNCMSDGAYGMPLTSTVGATFTHTYTTAGTFEFFCEPHCVSAGMKGTITVD